MTTEPEPLVALLESVLTMPVSHPVERALRQALDRARELEVKRSECLSELRRERLHYPADRLGANSYQRGIGWGLKRAHEIITGESDQ